MRDRVLDENLIDTPAHNTMTHYVLYLALCCARYPEVKDFISLGPVVTLVILPFMLKYSSADISLSGRVTDIVIISPGDSAKSLKIVAKVIFILFNFMRLKNK